MNYEINENTQVLLPVSDNETKVVETNYEYNVQENIFKVVESSCEYFGSTYEGRKNGTKNLLGITHKAPIIIEDSHKIILFPTTSPSNKECIWINLNHIKRYRAKNSTTSEITFQNGDVLELDLSIGSLTNQILRATRLRYVLDERIAKSQKEEKDN